MLVGLKFLVLCLFGCLLHGWLMAIWFITWLVSWLPHKKDAWLIAWLVVWLDGC